MKQVMFFLLSEYCGICWQFQCLKMKLLRVVHVDFEGVVVGGITSVLLHAFKFGSHKVITLLCVKCIFLISYALSALTFWGLFFVHIVYFTVFNF